MAFFLTKSNVEDKQLGIYVHVPFCKSKCEYCDFYSIGGGRDRRVTDDYLQALADHIREAGRLAPEYLVDTVYFGGGTPSFFGADNLEKILDEIHKSFRLSIEAEITLEANPDSVTLQSMKKLVRAGFNRISIGVQSDDDAMLKKLGRPHNFHQAKQAMTFAPASCALATAMAEARSLRDAVGFWPSSLIHSFLRPSSLPRRSASYSGDQPTRSGVLGVVSSTGSSSR